MKLPVWRLAELIAAYECVDESEAWRRALTTPDRSGSMELRDKIAATIWDHLRPIEDTTPVADAILAIPEIDPTPTRERILAMLGGVRDDMTPEQIKTIQAFADMFPNTRQS